MSSSIALNPPDYQLRSKKSLTPDGKNKIAKEKSLEEKERSHSRRLNPAQKQDPALSPSKTKEKPQAEKGGKTAVVAPAGDKGEKKAQKIDSEKPAKQQPVTVVNPGSGEKADDQEKKKKQASAGESYISIFSEYTSKSGPSIKENWEGVKTYTLYEDLKILCEVAKDRSHEGLGPKFWKNVEEKKEIRRSVESMRDRYKRFLRFLGKAEFDRIVAYLKKHGIKGFLHFEKDPNTTNVRILKKISEEDPNVVASKTNIEKANKSENRRRDPSVPRVRTKAVKPRTTTVPSAVGPIEIRAPLVGFGPKIKAKLAGIPEGQGSNMEEETITMGSLKRLEKIVQQKNNNNPVNNNAPNANQPQGNNSSGESAPGVNNQSNSNNNNTSAPPLNNSSNESNLRLQVPSLADRLPRKQQQQQQQQQAPPQQPSFLTHAANTKRKAPLVQYDEIYDYERAPEKRLYGGGAPRTDPYRGRYEPPVYEHRYAGYHPGPTPRSPYYSGGFGNTSSAYYPPHRPSPYKYSAEKKRSISKDMGATVGDLNQVLDVFEKMFNLPKETIIEEFIAVSGDTKDLYELLDGRNENLRWTPEEDELLENLRGVEDPQFRILARYKGVERMRKRVDFRKLDIEFDF